ncbi:MAG: hypothetical protein WBQ17_08765 [Rhizomicrobium sp.]
MISVPLKFFKAPELFVVKRTDSGVSRAAGTGHLAFGVAERSRCLGVSVGYFRGELRALGFQRFNVVVSKKQALLLARDLFRVIDCNLDIQLMAELRAACREVKALAHEPELRRSDHHRHGVDGHIARLLASIVLM